MWFHEKFEQVNQNLSHSSTETTTKFGSSVVKGKFGTSGFATLTKLKSVLFFI
jgi:hypothetical protein